MARNFDGSVDEAHNLSATGLPTAWPVTLASWVNMNSADLGTMICVGDDNTANNYIIIGADVSASDVTFFARKNGGGSEQGVSGTTPFSTGIWHHVVGVFRGDTDTEVYVNGISDGTSGTSATFPSGLDLYSVGHLRNNSISSSKLDGIVAETAVWDVALSDAEIISLANGLSPQGVRHDAIKFHAPLWGDSSPEIDLSVNDNKLTLVSAPPKADHAPVGRLVNMPIGNITGRKFNACLIDYVTTE